MIVGVHVGVDQDRSEQHEVAVLGVDHVAVDAHVSHPGLHGDQLVGDLPRGLARLVTHREPDRCRNRSDAVCVQGANDPVRGFVELGVVGLPCQVGRRSRDRSDCIRVRHRDDRYERAHPWKQPLSVGVLSAKGLAPELDQADICGAGVAAQRLQPLAVDLAGLTRRGERQLAIAACLLGIWGSSEDGPLGHGYITNTRITN